MRTLHVDSTDMVKQQAIRYRKYFSIAIISPSSKRHRFTNKYQLNYQPVNIAKICKIPQEIWSNEKEAKPRFPVLYRQFFPRSTRGNTSALFPITGCHTMKSNH